MDQCPVCGTSPFPPLHLALITLSISCFILLYFSLFYFISISFLFIFYFVSVSFLFRFYFRSILYVFYFYFIFIYLLFCFFFSLVVRAMHLLIVLVEIESSR